MRLLLVGAALLLVLDMAAGALLLGDRKCTWGPSYWCSGLQQSAKCSSTRHCIDNVWSSNPYPADDDEVCKICKEMVKEARDQLESNETQTEIKEVLEGSCKLIPIKLIADECIKLSDQFMVELIEMLVSEMDPNTVCAVSGLCNSGRIDRLLKEQRKRRVITDCDVCHEQMQKMSLKIRLMEKDNVVDKGLEMCGRLPSFYSDGCKILLLQNFDIFYQSLTHLDFICETGAICSDSSENAPTALDLAGAGPGLECEFCEKVIQHWIDEWKSNTSMEEFKRTLDTLCNELGQPDRIQRCLHIVDDYYIPVFKFILNELNPEAACSAVGLCGPNGFMEVDPSIPITALLPHDSTPEQKQLLGVESEHAAEDFENRLIGGYFAPQTLVSLSTPGCPICEFVLYRLREWLQDERTEDEIDRELHDICSAMPSSLKEQCGNFVETYGQAAIKLIVNGSDPKQVCTVLQLCPRNQPEEALLQSGGESYPIVAMKRKDDECATCQYVTAIVIETIKNKDDRDEIRNVLDSVCTLMPSSVADRCESFVNKYAEMIMEMIADNMMPEQICEGLGLCEKKAPAVDDQKCVICEYVIRTLDSIIEDKANEESIKHALENVCGYLPKTITKECVSFVDTYTDTIIDLLTHGTSPEEVCTSIGLCGRGNVESSSSSSSSEEEEDSSEEEEGKDDRPYCMLCEYAVGEVHHIVEDKHNKEEVKQALDAICYKLSKPITKECLVMVNKYTDEIIEMFARDYTPEKVCTALHLCEDRQEQELQLLSNVIDRDITPAEGSELQVEEGKLCGICEFGIAVVENKILNRRNLDAVQRAVLLMCSYLPGTLADKCEDLVEKYGDKIIHLIVDTELTPQEICTELRVCPKETLWDATSVGGRKCVWGPAFWCKSAFHASACGTTEYCARSGRSGFSRD